MADETTEGRKQWRRIIVDGADITEHVAAMFDAIVGSTDWGSGFLSSEEIESILLVAEMVGFDAPAVHPPDVDLPDNPPLPKGVTTGPGGWPVTAWPSIEVRDEYQVACKAAHAERERRTAEAIAAWRAQIKAKAEAMRGGDR